MKLTLKEKADLHAEITTYEVGWKHRLILHALVDLNLITRIECMMEDCRYPSRKFKKLAKDRTDGEFPSLDHFVPRSEGGSDRPENIRPAHKYCNSVAKRRAREEQ